MNVYYRHGGQAVYSIRATALVPIDPTDAATPGWEGFRVCGEDGQWFNMRREQLVKVEEEADVRAERISHEMAAREFMGIFCQSHPVISDKEFELWAKTLAEMMARSQPATPASLNRRQSS
jgi:hypothetical protein